MKEKNDNRRKKELEKVLDKISNNKNIITTNESFLERHDNLSELYYLLQATY